MKTRVDISNQKFNRLTAIRFDHKEEKSKGKRRYFWIFECICGKLKVLNRTDVLLGKVKSCGCLKRELDKGRNKTHKMHKTRFYGIWCGIKTRCNNKNRGDYERYGGRGIKVCNRWLKFENFHDDMYKKYLEHVKEFGSKDTTIERINNNGNYCKENCIFATYREQANNRRQRSKKTLYSLIFYYKRY